MVRVITYFSICFLFALNVDIAQSQKFSPVIPGEDGIPDAQWPSSSYRTFDRVAVSAGIGPLREKKLSPEEKEIRVWIGGGITTPELLFIIREKDGFIEGEHILYWRIGDGNQPEGETTHDLIIYNYTGQCENFTLGNGVGTCGVLFTEEPDWGKISEKVTETGIWDIPDESKYHREPEVLEDGSVVIYNLSLDGIIITVELHDGRDYRSYQYSNPQDKVWPEAKKMVQISSIISEIRSNMKSSDVKRNYIGITRGNYRSAFHVCGNDEVWGFRAAGNIDSLAERAEIKLPEPGKYGYVAEVYGIPTPEWLAKRWESEFTRELQPIKLISVEPAIQPNCN